MNFAKILKSREYTFKGPLTELFEKLVVYYVCGVVFRKLVINKMVHVDYLFCELSFISINGSWLF